MSARKKSAMTDDFFDSAKSDNGDVNEKPNDENDLRTSAVANLIRTQPVIHHPNTTSNTPSHKTSESTPMKMTQNKTPVSSIATPKHVNSTPSKEDISDIANYTEREKPLKDIETKHKLNPIAPSKPVSYSNPARDNSFNHKPSRSVPNPNRGRAEPILPRIRPKKQRKGITKRYVKEHKNEIEQRLLSAHNNKLKQLESSIAELSRLLDEERRENKTLRLINEREEKDLQKYADQETDLLLVAREYSNDIKQVGETILQEREIKSKLQQEIERRDNILYKQRKRIEHFKNLINDNKLDEADQLRERLKEANSKLDRCQEKLSSQEKKIVSIEKTCRQEIHAELVKQRDLKQEIENQSKKYTDLLAKCEDKTREIDTMHIYIQRGGRRPSHSSSNLRKSISFQSLQDTSPRFREKILDYDRKRREQEKLKPRPKPQLSPIRNPTVKRERKKYVPNFDIKPNLKQQSSVLSHIKRYEPSVKTAAIEDEPVPIRDQRRRRISSPESIFNLKSDIEDETASDFIHLKPPSAPTKGMHRREQHLSQTPVPRHPLTHATPPLESKHTSSITNKITSSSNHFKNLEPLPPLKPSVKRDFNETWSKINDESNSDDFLSNLISHEPKEKKPTITVKAPPSSSSHITSTLMFEAQSVATNGHQPKPPTLLPTKTVFDFDVAFTNLHNGKPATTPPKRKTSIDPFESLFNDKSTSRIKTRDETFTTMKDKSDPFDFPGGNSTSVTNHSTAIRSYPLPNDQSQRPKVVNNPTKLLPDRTDVDDIEDFVL